MSRTLHAQAVATVAVLPMGDHEGTVITDTGLADGVRPLGPRVELV